MKKIIFLVAFVASTILTSCGWGTFIQDMNAANANPNRTSFTAEMQKIRDAGGTPIYTVFFPYNAFFQGTAVPKTLEQHNSYYCEYELKDERYVKIVAYEATDHLTALVADDYLIKGYYKQDGYFDWDAAVTNAADTTKNYRLFMKSDASYIYLVLQNDEGGRIFKTSLSNFHVVKN